MYDKDGKETNNVEDCATIKTNYLSKKNETSIGANKIPAFDGTVLAYKDVKVACKVVKKQNQCQAK